MAKPQETQVQPIEILSTIAAHVEGQNGVALVIRADPTNSFGSQTIFVSQDQMARLLEDCSEMLQEEQSVWK